MQTLAHMKSYDLSLEEKMCVLSFDEMKVREEWAFDRKNDIILPPARMVQVAMVRSLRGSWMQPVFYNFDCEMTENILLHIIRKLYSIGYTVVATVCDQGPENQKLWRAMQIKIQEPFFKHPSDASKLVFVFPDIPHLIKLLRNHFLDDDYYYKEVRLSKSIVEELISLCDSDLTITKKVSMEMITVTGAARQKVKHAVKLFSHTTASALKRVAELGACSDARKFLRCAEFFQLINDWFDIFNARTASKDTRPLSKAYGLSLTQQNATLQTMTEIVLNLFPPRKSGVLLPFQRAILQANNVLPRLFEYLPFSTVASLNGFHMFFKSLGITLQVTYAEDWTYVWRDFQNAVTLIVCGRSMTEGILQTLAEVVFGAIALFVNYNELVDLTLLDRMKKEARNYVPLVDAALEVCTTRILGFTDCTLSVENQQLAQRLNEFSGLCGSLFCCLVVGNSVAVGTEGWWDLDPIDRELLLLLLNSSSTLQNDVPVYLPKRDSMLAYRFVTIPLAPTSVICVICGAAPGCHELRAMAQSVFLIENQLQNVERCMTRELPEYFEVDQCVLAMIIANINVKKCVFSRNLNQYSGGKRALGGGLLRLDLLKKIFDQTLQHNKSLNSGEYKDVQLRSRYMEPLDQYWCLEYHKCYAHYDQYGNTIFILFMSSIPTPAMRFIAQKLLYSILQDKAIAW